MARARLQALNPLIALGALGYIAASVLSHVLHAYQISRLESLQDDYTKAEQIYETLESYGKIFPGVEALTALAACVGLAVAARALRPRLRLAAIAGAVALGGVAADRLVAWYAHRFEAWDSSLVQLFVHKHVEIVLFACAAAGLALLGTVYFRHGRDETSESDPRLIVFAILAAASYIVPAHDVLAGEPLLAGSTWLRFALSSGFLAVGGGVLASAVVVPRSAMLHTSAAADPRELSDARWSGVADGLFTCGNALTWRLWVAVFAAMGMFWALLAKSEGMVELVSILTPVAVLIIMVMMLVGVFRYAAQPASSPAGATAWLAFVVMLAGLALEGYGFKLTFDIVGVDTQDWDSIRRATEAQEKMESMSLWLLLMPFAGVLLLLSSFAQLAHHIGRRELAQRAGGVVLLLIGGAALLAFLLDQRESVDSVHEVILLGGIMLTVVVGILRQLISLVGALEAAVRGTSVDGEVPRARVL